MSTASLPSASASAVSDAPAADATTTATADGADVPRPSWPTLAVNGQVKEENTHAQLV